MYIDDFYTPSTQFGFEPDSSGYIPDQNQTVYYSPRDLQFQNQVDSDNMQQLSNFIAQQQSSTKKQSGYIAINKGDTLSKLAQQYGTTVEDLAKLNGIRDINKIKAGGILRLTNDVKNKYRDNMRTNSIRKRVKNTNTPTPSNVQVTAPKRNINTGKKPQTKSTNTNSNQNLIDRFMNIPIKTNSSGQLSAFSKPARNNIFEKIKDFFYTPPGAEQRVAERRRQLQQQFTPKRHIR